MAFPKARARVEYWRAVWKKAKPGTARRSRAFHMLKRRKAQLARLIIRRRRQGVRAVSSRGIALIAEFEGFRSRPYRDPVGIWTIGYGETRGIGPGTAPWSEPFARHRLRVRVNRDYLAPVLAAARRAGIKLTQNEADALASLVYNCGPGILAPGRTMGSALRSRSRPAIANAFLAYRFAGGRVLPGLERRRRAERSLFLSK